MSTKHIIVLRNDQIGDTCLSAPMLQKIKDIWPESKLTVISSVVASHVVDLLSCVDQIILDFKENKQSRLSLFQLTAELKKLNADMIFFSKMDPDYIIAAKLAKIQIRVGDKNNVLMSPLLSHKISICWHDFSKHEADQQLRLLSLFNSSLDIPEIKFKEDKKIQKSLFQTYFNKKEYIVVHPSFGKGNRALTAIQYKQIIELIIEKGCFDIVITGTNKDMNFIREMKLERIPSVINLVGELSIKQLYFVLKYASVFIGAETGPMHLASILKKKIINISPTKYTRSFRWGPFNTSHVIVKNNQSCDLVCNTYKNNCKENFCINSILATDVVKAVDFLLENSHFPKDPLVYWIKTNSTINVVLNSDNVKDIELVNNLIEKFSKNFIQYKIIIASKKVNIDAIKNKSELQISYLKNIRFWVSFLARQQSPIVHYFGPRNVVWNWIIKKLVALKVDVEPLIVTKINIDKPLIEIFSDYIKESKLLS